MFSSSFRAKAPLAIALFLLLASAAFGQSSRAQIRGLITDQSGAALPGATVTLSNINTGLTSSKQTENSGLYLFDFVDPGSYKIDVEASGFGKYAQENISVQSGGDVTVNATLSAGTLQQSVTVDAAPPAVQFNTSNQELTIDTKMANDTPRLDRNPFKLTLLLPAAVNTRGETLPFQSWAANSIDLGGGTNLKNDLLVDGNPIGIGHKNGYPPNQDAVQETIASQNSVNAESGHSAGGVISITTKSGTNEWHGGAFYLGRYPFLSAEADRTRFTQNAQRQNMIGGTLGSPIIKNKLFNFVSVEWWKISSPGSFSTTVPTPLEREGDFSQTRAADGTQRTIFDPFSTQIDAGGNVMRTPFAGNKIPSSRFDPLAARQLGALWDPNNPGVGYNHQNNFQVGFANKFDYYNISDKVDYNINDKWRVSGSWGRYHTDNIASNPTPNNSILYQPAGSLREANLVRGDAVWAISPTTVLNFHGDWFNLVDAYVSQDLGENGWSSIWPDNNWYQPYLSASSNVPVFYPSFVVGGNTFGGPGFFWDQRPAAESFSIRASHSRGAHYIKAGFEYRRGGGPTYVSNTNRFFFDSNLTSNAINNPDTTKYGDPFATFLLGALDERSQMIGGPAPEPITNFYGIYFGDDWKISRNITLNLGVRQEYEAAWHDKAHNLSRFLNLGNADPNVAANPVAQPTAVTNAVGANYWSLNGLWNFTDDKNQGSWNPQLWALQPRFGVAWRLNDKTALRFGYAMYSVPTEYNFTNAPISGFEAISFLSPPFFGITGYQNTAPLQNGVPRQSINDPFPSGSNPLLPVQGRAAGTNVGRGGTSLFWFPEDFQRAYNHRLNFTLEHQLPGQMVVSGTYFVNFGNQHYTKPLNNINPSVLANLQGAVNESVPNPFYQYLNQTLVPGPLFNQQTVPLGSLLSKYPLYGSLSEVGRLGAGERYQNLEFRLQKRFSQGYNFLFGYVYIREKVQRYFNDQASYTDTLTWQENNQPRHRITSAGTLELPFGKGKQFLGSAGRAADAIIGGWQITGLLTFNTGDYPRFDNYTVTGDPCENVPSGFYFNPAVFQRITNSYTLRNNPLQYSCIVGPKFLNLDATLQKSFSITERVKAQLKMSAYNATNRLNFGSPDTNINNATFGQSIYQGAPAGEYGSQSATYGNQAGRQVELGFRLIF